MAELRQRAVKWTDADWQTVQQSAKSAGKTAAEWVRERTTAGETDTVDPVTAAILDRLTAERDAALKLAKAAEDNAAAGNDTWIVGLEPRINERARALGMTPEAWVRGLVELTLERPLKNAVAPEPKGKTPDGDAREAAILEEYERRKAAHGANGGAPYAITRSRFAHLKTAPKGSPNLTWKLGQEPGPPAWMTAPTTTPGMTCHEALAAGMTAARYVMSGKKPD